MVHFIELCNGSETGHLRYKLNEEMDSQNRYIEFRYWDSLPWTTPATDDNPDSSMIPTASTPFDDDDYEDDNEWDRIGKLIAKSGTSRLELHLLLPFILFELCYIFIL